MLQPHILVRQTHGPTQSTHNCDMEEKLNMAKKNFYYNPHPQKTPKKTVLNSVHLTLAT